MSETFMVEIHEMLLKKHFFLSNIFFTRMSLFFLASTTPQKHLFIIKFFYAAIHSTFLSLSLSPSRFMKDWITNFFLRNSNVLRFIIFINLIVFPSKKTWKFMRFEYQYFSTRFFSNSWKSLDLEVSREGKFYFKILVWKIFMWVFLS